MKIDTRISGKTVILMMVVFSGSYVAHRLSGHHGGEVLYAIVMLLLANELYYDFKIGKELGMLKREDVDVTLRLRANNWAEHAVTALSAVFMYVYHLQNKVVGDEVGETASLILLIILSISFFSKCIHAALTYYVIVENGRVEIRRIVGKKDVFHVDDVGRILHERGVLSIYTNDGRKHFIHVREIDNKGRRALLGVFSNTIMSSG